MQNLLLPKVELSLKLEGNSEFVLDVFRNKWVRFTPEENVRQHILHYLVNQKGYKKGLISVEKEISINNLSRRYDAVCYTKLGQPTMLIECKAPEVKITNETFLQIAHYNTVLKVPYLLVTNGISHFISELNLQSKEITFLKEIPTFNQ